MPPWFLPILENWSTISTKQEVRYSTALRKKTLRYAIKLLWFEHNCNKYLMMHIHLCLDGWCGVFLLHYLVCLRGEGNAMRSNVLFE